MKRPRIVVSMGDPAGIGAEITLKALSAPETAALADWLVVGDEGTWNAAAKTCGIAPESLPFQFINAGMLDATVPVQPGALKPEYGSAAVAYVRMATELCLSGKADAMVTAPLHKEAVALSGMHFSGHTEYIAELCGANDPCMLLANESMAVAHVSTHVSLANACRLSTARVLRTIELGARAVEDMRGHTPRIAVCGLNPHAGEHGLFGCEDLDVIQPAINQARAKGTECSGPHSADTVFLQAFRAGKYDLVVAMYHDQGHIPMKLMAFEDTVNITLGIPIIRTSVDHGTAFDIAGRNQANPRNMKSAMRLAAAMAAAKGQV